MLPAFVELLDPKKTAQPQEQDPKDDLLDHRRRQAATIEPKTRRRRRWLWLKDTQRSSELSVIRSLLFGRPDLKDESLEDSAS